jgi:hypothetical protein
VPDLGLGDVFRAITAIRRETPDLAWMLDVPGVGNQLIRLGAGEIDQQEFWARVYRTSWWRHTSDAQRQWRALDSIDPAQSRRQRQQMTLRVQQMMGEMGVRIPQQDRRYQQGHGATRYRATGAGPAANIADLALYNGWDENQITNYLLSFATWGDEGGRPTGGLAVAQTQIRQLEEQYGVEQRGRNRFNQARQVLRGRQTVEGLEETLRQRALTRYGGNDTIVDVLNNGGTVMDFFDPYRQMFSQELEVPQETISLNDPRYQRVLSHAADGRTRPMTMDEARSYIRSRAEWAETGNARKMQAGMARSLLNTFGRTA